MRKRTSLSVLLIEADATGGTRVQGMLPGNESSGLKLRRAAGLNQALEWLEHDRFDAALLVVGQPDRNALTGYARLRSAAPSLPAMILGACDDEEFAVRVVRAGAEEYLVTDSLESGALCRAIRCAVERSRRIRRTASPRSARRVRHGAILVLAGAKGGVGTTTTALNVAAAIAEQGKRVIAAELRGSYGGMAAQLGELAVRDSIASLLSREAGDTGDAEVAARVVWKSSALGFLFAPQRAAEARTLDGARARAILTQLSLLADYVVADLPSRPTEALREAVRMARLVGVAVDREASCLPAARVLLDHIRSWRRDATLGLVVVHRSPLACPVELDEITKELGLGVLELIPPAPDSCQMAAKAGVPVIDAYQETLIASSLRQLAVNLSSNPVRLRSVV